jgi:hypothetical protein
LIIGMFMLGPIFIFPAFLSSFSSVVGSGPSTDDTKSSRSAVEQMLSDKNWQGAINSMGNIDGPKNIYLNSQNEFLQYQVRVQNTPAKEKAAVLHQFAASPPVAALPNEHFEKVSWEPDAQRVFAIENAAFGAPQSQFAKQYLVDQVESRQRNMQRSKIAGILGGIALLIAASLGSIGSSLRFRVARIRDIAFPSGQQRKDVKSAEESIPDADTGIEVKSVAFSTATQDEFSLRLSRKYTTTSSSMPGSTNPDSDDGMLMFAAGVAVAQSNNESYQPSPVCSDVEVSNSWESNGDQNSCASSPDPGQDNGGWGDN